MGHYKDIQGFSVDHNGDLFVTDGGTEIFAYFDVSTAQFKRKENDTPILATEMIITKYMELPKQAKTPTYNNTFKRTLLNS